MATTKKLEWFPIDMNTMSAELVAEFDAAKELYATYKAQKNKAENMARVAAALPATHTLRFAYNYGPAFALDVADEPKSAKKGALSLADMAAKVAAPSTQTLIKKVA